MLNSRKCQKNIAWILIALGLFHCTKPYLNKEELSPLPKLPDVPGYTKLPHPEGFDLSDVYAVFHDRKAPKRQTLLDCDKDQRALAERTKSKDEIARGSRELVSNNPELMHWCFYDRILRSQEETHAKDLLLDRQKTVISHYRFLTPIANGFRIEFNDTRYIRWAIHHYQNLSNWLFYRSLTLKPDAMDHLLNGVDNLHALHKKSNPPDIRNQPVLEKYKISEKSALPLEIQNDLKELEAAAADAQTIEVAPLESPVTPTQAPALAQDPAPASKQRAPAELEEIPVEPTKVEGDYFDSE
jgi:hypothetical protein